MDDSIKKAVRFINKANNYREGDSHKFFLFLRENRTLYSILLCNYKELNKALKHQNSEQSSNVFWNSDNSFRFKLQKNTIRIFSNYLNSLFTIVDYTRSTLVKYIERNAEVFLKYEAKKQEFLNNNETHKFIQDLRNYSCHKTYLKIGSYFSYNIELGEQKNTIFVSKNELLLWDQWSKESKKFIERSGDKIHLNEIIMTHFEEFIEFQNWIYLQLLLVDVSKTQTMIVNMTSIYNEALLNNQKHLLLFKESYLRYINIVFTKAKNT